jgi:hypothetical protein
VGGSFHLRRGKDRIVYAGMPGDNVYSIVQKKADGYQGYSWNLYFRRERSQITIDGVDLLIESVTADEIRFRIA